MFFEQIPSKTTTTLTIYSPGAAYGGYSYRARWNGKNVLVQESGPEDSGYTTLKTITRMDWERLVAANDHQLDNPGWISRVANEQDHCDEDYYHQ